MKKIILSVVTAMGLAACASPNTQLEQQAGLAVNWMQESGEFKALSYQAFNFARIVFDNAAAPNGQKKAVVVDLDETMLDNSAYAAWRIKNNIPFKQADWTRWVNARQTTAMAGAVEFNNYVNSRGGKVFYVSNRLEKEEQAATLENMKRLGFTGVDDQSLLLKTDRSNKSVRFQQVQDQGYAIVAFMGDNLNDFGDKTYRKDNAQRRQFVDQNKQLFGTKFIVLPNPSYGDWESGMAKGYYSLTPQGKLDARRKALRTWDGK